MPRCRVSRECVSALAGRRSDKIVALDGKLDGCLRAGIDAGFIMAPDQRVYQRVFYTVGFVRARNAGHYGREIF